MIPTDFSIIICTYNGGRLLGATLSALRQLVYNFLKWELIIVDNASNDDTLHEVKRLLEELHFDCRVSILSETAPGKMNALNTASRIAAGNFCVICDDDNWLDKNYLQVAVDFFSTHPRAGIIGGWSTAVSDVAFPPWFPAVQHDYACGKEFDVTAKHTGKFLVKGAGSVIRTELLCKVFDEEYPPLLSCRKGEELISGGDDEICFRIWLMDYDSYFVDKLHFQHYMPAVRLSLSYYEKLKTGFHQQAEVVQAYWNLYESHLARKKSFFALQQLRLKQYLRLVKSFMDSSPIRQRDARQLLYFTTGNKRFATKVGTEIYNYYQQLSTKA